MKRSREWFSLGKREAPETRHVIRIEFDNGYSLNISNLQLPFTIGRSPESDLVVASEFVSRSHCTLEERDDEVQIVDQSVNGTFIDDHRLKHEAARIEHRIHLLFGGEFMLALTPYDENGNLREAPQRETSQRAVDAHGIVLVDLCDSTEKTPAQVGVITQALRIEMLRRHRDQLLMIKNTGDGFLLVYDNPDAAFEAARRVLRHQRSRGDQFDFDIRVTLDAGLTTETADRDRLGLAINRAARIEKTQAGNIVERGPEWDRLNARNRCILTEDMKRALTLTDRARCQHIGAVKLKGFGETLHPVFQFPFDA